ncbi:MAG TPA: DUF3619 family protein [Burkholderiaceae bacterium]|nr:DUF3619 family protein [Burkholderiaceae bacterium]
MKDTSAQTPTTGPDTLEARLGLRVTAALSAAAAELPADVTQRLRFAREQALARRKPAAEQTAHPALPAGNALVLGGGARGRERASWRWAASLVPLAVLLGGLFLIQERHFERQVEEAADIDAALLADDLPPAAYADPGFREFLKTPRP